MLHCSSERRAIARGHAIKPSPRTHRGDAAPATYTGVSISDLFQAFDADAPLDILVHQHRRMEPTGVKGGPGGIGSPTVVGVARPRHSLTSERCRTWRLIPGSQPCGLHKKTTGIIRVRLSELYLRSRSSQKPGFDGAPVEKFLKANGIHPHLEIEELSVTFDLDLWPFMNVVCGTLSCDTI